MTQCEQILHHMQTLGSITSLEAVQKYGIMRLASRITDLRRRGIAITRQIVKGKNRYGEVTSYAAYQLEKK